MKRDIAFNSIFRAVKRLVVLNGIFLAGMSLFRFVFFLYFGSHENFSGLHHYLAQAFILGFRYDLAVAAYINTLVTLGLFGVWIAGRKRWFGRFLSALKYYYSLMYSLVFLVLIVDFGFYTYFKNHINILIFGIFEDDTMALATTILQNYNVPLVIAGVALLLAAIYLVCRYFITLIRRSDVPVQRGYALRYKTGFVVLLLSLNTLAARGSLGMFPLGTIDAEISPNVFINKLGPNGIFTLQEAIDFRLREDKDYDLVKLVGFDGRMEKAFSAFLGIDGNTLPKDALYRSLVRKTRPSSTIERIRPNVVVIIMEGFGSDLLRHDSDNFNVLGELKKHFDSDYVFTNFLSADVGTIGSLESMVMNIPKRPLSKAITQSRYAYDPHVTGAAFPYRRAGYDTVFLYGGNVGWRNLLAFLPSVGFDTVEGEGSMPSGYLRNQWGVYDEHLFDYLYGKLAVNDGKPKFIMALTTSNHPPYSLPPSYRQLPLTVSDALNKEITGDKQLARGRFMTYQYANQKLGELISRIKASELGNNTIIAVTGDHNFWSVFDYGTDRYLDLDGVPFYLYVPYALKPKEVDTAAFGSHIDIMPTLYNLSLSGREYMALGNDMLDRNAPHIAYNVDGIVFSREGGIKYSPENNTVSFFGWDTASKRRLVSAGKNAAHEGLLTYYKAALAITEYLVKNPVRDGNL